MVVMSGVMKIKHPLVDRTLRLGRDTYPTGRTPTGAYVKINAEGISWGRVTLNLIGADPPDRRKLPDRLAIEARRIAHDLADIYVRRFDRGGSYCVGPERIEWFVPRPLVAGALDLMLRSLDGRQVGIGLSSFAEAVADAAGPVRAANGVAAGRAAALLAEQELAARCFDRLIVLPLDQYPWGAS
jgi:hypothetical protein